MRTSTGRRQRRKEKPQSPPGLVTVSQILLAILLLASPMLIGGVHAITAVLIAVVATVGLGLPYFVPRGRATGSLVVSIPTVAMGAMAVVTLMQLMPVPTVIYRVLQPEGYGYLVENYALLGEGMLGSGWHVLSTDPRATVGVALKWVALAAVSALATEVIGDSETRTRCFGVILITGGMVAVAGAVQLISDTELILGVYQAELLPSSISPFVNKNHAAGYYGLIALVGLCFAYDYLRRSPLKATLGFGASVVAMLLAMAHDSDGSNLAMLLGLSVLGGGLLFRSEVFHNKDKRPGVRGMAVGGLLLLSVGAFFLPERFEVTQENTHSVLEEGSAKARLHFIGAALEGSKDFAFVGAGAGSVDRSLAPYLDWEYLGSSAVPTIENEPMEWVFTYGPVVAVLFLIAMGVWIVRLSPALKDPRGRRGKVYALALVVYLLVLSMFHFPFFTLGISVVALVAISASLNTGVEVSRGVKAVFTLGLLAATLGLWGLGETVLAEGVEESLEVENEEGLKKAMWLYPTDGRLLSAVSLKQWRAGEVERALAMARQAYELRPHPQQEYLLARMLVEAGEVEEAAEVYGGLLSEERRQTGLRGRVMNRLYTDLRAPELVAVALREASSEVMRRVVRQIEGDVGGIEAIEVVQALIEVDRGRADERVELIELYRRAEQVELAEMYARSLVNRNLETDEGERPAGLGELLQILSREGRLGEARGLARRALAQGVLTPKLGREVVRWRPAEGPEAMSEEDWTLFEQAVEIGCPSPYETRGIQRLCWEAKAFEMEGQGDVEGAEELLGRVERQYGDPRALANFLARQYRCREMAALVRRLQENAEGRFVGHVERQARGCAEEGWLE